MLFSLLLLHIFCPLNARARDLNFSTSQIRKLANFKHYICGLTNHSQYVQFPRGLYGWACVKPSECANLDDRIFTIDEGKKSNIACDALRYNDDRDTCCLLDNLWSKADLGPSNGFDWDLYSYDREKTKAHDLARFDVYKYFWFSEFFGDAQDELEKALKEHEICSIQAVGIDKGRATYAPYICVTEEQCQGPKHENVKVDIEFPFGDRFCQKSFIKDRPVCCHVSTVVSLNKNSPPSWNFTEFLPTQNYAPGFRATLMCENYQRLVCEEKIDRCAQKILYRYDSATAGEFSHHALVGVYMPLQQTFHCHGAVISKQFVLSSYDCRMHDFTLANVVHVGYFDYESEDEMPKRDQITYIKNHFSLKEKHWFLLLKLWRPLEFSFVVRPACIDWYTYNTDLDSKEFNYGMGWMSTHGPQTTDGTFSNNVTRYTYDMKSSENLNTEEQRQCLLRVPDLYKPFFPKSWSDVHNHICVRDEKVYSPYYDDTRYVDQKQLTYLGYLSQGAPFSTFDRYCQWSVYGVYIQNENWLTEPPMLVETVPHALAWIEDIIWQDFSLLFLNFSWPDCADWEDVDYTRRVGDPNNAFHQLNFRTKDYLYMKPQVNEFYKLE